MFHIFYMISIITLNYPFDILQFFRAMLRESYIDNVLHT